MEVENGGAGVYNVDLNKHYLFTNPDWKYDAIPEILGDKNIADFIDLDIEAKLDTLEREEDLLIEQGFYELASEHELDSEEEAIKTAADQIRIKKKLMVNTHRMNKKNHAGTKPRQQRDRSVSSFQQTFKEIGLESNKALASVQAQKRQRSESRGVSTARLSEVTTVSKRMKSQVRDRSTLGTTETGKKKSESVKKLGEVKRNMEARAGEADRKILCAMPKHLFAGKRGMGKTDRR